MLLPFRAIVRLFVEVEPDTSKIRNLWPGSGNTGAVIVKPPPLVSMAIVSPIFTVVPAVVTNLSPSFSPTPCVRLTVTYEKLKLAAPVPFLTKLI